MIELNPQLVILFRVFLKDGTQVMILFEEGALPARHL